MIDPSRGDDLNVRSDSPTAGQTPGTDAGFLRDVEALVDSQIASGGGYADEGDPETLPTVVFLAGWAR